MRPFQSGPASISLRRRGVLPPDSAIEKLPWSPYARRCCAAIQVATVSATSRGVSPTIRSPARSSRELVSGTSGEVPGAPVARHEGVRFLGTPGARRVVRAVGPIGRVRAPSIENRSAESPRLLDLVLSCQQSRIPEHAVEEKTLVSVGRLHAERGVVHEI